MESFSVSSWNVLAECYRSLETPSLYERKKLIHETLLKTASDIYCLQEVDHHEDLREALSQRYTSVYAQRPGRADGLLIAYDSLRFEKVGKELVVEFDDLAEMYDRHNKKLFTRANIGLCLLIREKDTGLSFLCANTHLYWNPSKSEVKLAQIRFFLEEVVKHFGSGESEIELPSLVLGGDFNSMPTSDLYKRITGDRLFEGSIYDRLSDGAERGEASQGELTQESAVLGGPGTKFLADHSLKKICSWLRLLGIDCAMESDECHKERTRKPVPNFDTLFAQARQEQRVILTSSRKVQERSACPQSYFVATTCFESSLVGLVREFGLQISEKTFLTVCGKCGGQIEKIERDDARLTDVPYLPTGRPIFCCRSCSQPYWWSERVDSSPARAMRVASRLYKLIQHGHKEGESQRPTARTSVYTADVSEEEKRQRNAFLAGDDQDDLDLTEMFEKRDACLAEGDFGGQQESEQQVSEQQNVRGQEHTANSVVRVRAAQLSAGLESAYASSHGGEPDVTNWNGDFKGCLDYIFTAGFTSIEGSGKVVPRISSGAVEATGSLDDDARPLTVPFEGKVTSDWPSDHFLVKVELKISNCK